MDSSSSDTEDPSTSLLSAPPADDDDDDDDGDGDGDAFEILARLTPSPDTIPWEQRSTKMKIVHVADRIFLIFLAVFLLILLGEVSYNLCHMVPWAAMYRALRDQLLMQEEGEEDLEL